MVSRGRQNRCDRAGRRLASPLHSSFGKIGNFTRTATDLSYRAMQADGAPAGHGGRRFFAINSGPVLLGASLLHQFHILAGQRRNPGKVTPLDSVLLNQLSPQPDRACARLHELL